jgi:hypothetical protein
MKMPPNEAEALADAERTLRIVNAMADAKSHDPRRTSVGLLAIIHVLIGDDQIGKIALARLMCEAASELLADVGHEYVVDVRRLN